jgi:hypothetical protein
MSTTGLLAAIDLYKYNPSGIQRVALQYLKDITNGVTDVVDPTNPFVFLLESSAVNTAAFMIQNAIGTRKQYPSVSQTFDDLYSHMSDKDYLDRFATPAQTTFTIMIMKSDLLKKMVYDPETLGSKVTIPKNTEFTVAGITFSMQYPVDIKQLVHGGLQVVYDGNVASPLFNLTTNVIEFGTRTDPQLVEWIYFDVIVHQFHVNTSTYSLTTSTGFKQTLAFKDEFYCARVYQKNSNTGNIWSELLTTHSDQVYDPIAPTAVLKVIDNVLYVTIPQIYLNTNLVSGTIRIDIYETKGKINLVMENFSISAFSFRWLNLASEDNTAFTAVIPTLTIIAYSAKTVSGGTPALTLAQLRKQVINNSIGDRLLPITPVQIESALEKKGYQVVRNTDVVTDRVFLATKPLPQPSNSKLITAAASSIEVLSISLSEAINYKGVVNNGDRVTFTPDLIYKNDSGLIKIVPQQQVINLINNTPDNIANAVNSAQYLYTPFHYVLDTTGDEFSLRPYYLDKPKVDSIHFIEQNDTTSFQINTSSFTVSKSITGYTLTVTTKSNSNTMGLSDSAIIAQLSYVPVGETERAYLNGLLSGRAASKERIFTFDLSTNFDIDVNNSLFLSQFVMITDTPRLCKTTLTNTFDILYCLNTVLPSSWVTIASDSLIGKFILPNSTVCTTREQIKVSLGSSLNLLWSRSRSVVGASNYLTHELDVPWRYNENVYAINSVTGSRFTIDPVTNKITENLLHRKGDVVYDDSGNVTYQYRKGDIRMGLDGKPMAVSAPDIIRQVELMFIEGAYYFATDSAASSYRADAVAAVVSWLTDDLINMSTNLLELTRLYFYPKTTLGKIKAVVDGGVTTVLDAGQSFVVDLYVTDNVYQNTPLREALKRTTISTIDDLLKQTVITSSTVISTLRDSYGSDVIGLAFSGFGGSLNFSTISLVNQGDRMNIKKRLVKLPDKSLIVQEDVTVNFVLHANTK